MADADIDSIDNAIVDSLSSLLKVANKPFATIERFVGQIDRVSKAHANFLNSSPALLPGLKSDDRIDVDGEVNTLGKKVETVGEATFAVFICKPDYPRLQKHALKTPSPTALPHPDTVAGAYRLLTLVKAVLSNLAIPGLWRNSRLRYVYGRPYYIQPGQLYVLESTWTARYRLPNAPDPVDPSREPLQLVVADYELREFGPHGSELPPENVVRDEDQPLIDDQRIEIEQP